LKYSNQPLRTPLSDLMTSARLQPFVRRVLLRTASFSFFMLFARGQRPSGAKR
jgi:hypothetical protein